MPSFLIAHAIDYTSLILGKCLMTYVKYCMLCTAGKLLMDSDKEVTFFLDTDLDSSFTKNVVNDAQCITNKEIKTIKTQVQ